MNTDDNKKSTNEETQQERNREATEKMAENDKQQYDDYQKNQNELNKSENPDNDPGSLSNNSEKPGANDSLHVEEQNKKRMESEEDQDFGIETIQE